VLSEVELDACADLLGELAEFAVERIVAEPLRADQISTKSSAADWVTEIDIDVERHVRDTVLARFPGHRVVGEELGTIGAEDAAATWYVDPVDGTTNFVHGLPWSSFSAVVADEEGPAAGVVVDPYRREVLSAVRGRGAYVDGTPSRCSAASELVGGIVLTELIAQSVWPGMERFIAALADRDCVTRIMGSNALSLASVGAGRVLATAIGSFGPLDCLAGALIARESGARVLARSGGDQPVVGGGVLCVAAGVVDELVSIWKDGPTDGA
jgi:myo-inositol-1(or 4)-monophosphatase